MTSRLPLAPADDLFSDDFITPMDIAVRAARRNNGRRVVVEVAPVEAPAVHRCGRCHRVLTSAASVAKGYGRTCSRRMDEAFALIGATFSARQIEAATELITDGGLVVGPKKSCIAVSSDGTSTYAVDPIAGTCTCKAGQYGRLCYHIASALVCTI